VVGGAGTSGTKALVVRASGPALAALGVPGTLPDPQLSVRTGQTVAAFNDNWGGTTALANAMAAVGAFAYPSTTSRDAAVAPTLPAGEYTVNVSSALANAAGNVLAEIYDATPAAAFTTTTPRLVNLSVLKTIAPGGRLTLGFTIAGSGGRTVLIRAIGPGLAAVGVTSGTLADPQLTLFDASSSPIAVNNDWGGATELVQAITRVGAFALTNAASRDAVLLRSLPAGSYTATVTGNGGTSGLVIVEVYEVP
jgi:hypothetical protein